MKSVFISTVLGPDNPDVIKSLANVTREKGGEWLTSKVVKLDGQFAAINKVVVDKDKEVTLKMALEEQFSDLTFVYAGALSDTGEPLKTINLVVDCNNRAGLTKEINNIIEDLGLTVQSMELHRFHVSNLGEAVYSNKLAIAAPEGLAAETVAEKLEAIPDGARVTVLS